MSVGSCETIEDYFINIKYVLDECEELTKELKKILRKNITLHYSQKKGDNND